MTAGVSKYLAIYSNKEFIVRESDTDQDFFCLVEGLVGIWKGDPEDPDAMVKVGELAGRGIYFGEMSYLLGEERTASIIAQGDVKVLRFRGDMLPQMILKQPQLGLKLLTAVADRLKGTTNKTEDIAQQRDALRDDATQQLLHAKEMFQKTFMLLTAIAAQTQNPLIKSCVEYMSHDKLLQGAKRMRIDDRFTHDLPEILVDISKKFLK